MTPVTEVQELEQQRARLDAERAALDAKIKDARDPLTAARLRDVFGKLVNDESTWARTIVERALPGDADVDEFAIRLRDAILDPRLRG